MKCAFCGMEFDEMAARRLCSSCALFGGCRMVKCPRCGYETPEEPGLIKWIRKRVRKKEGQR
jgi:adenine-specific DNA methylase